MQTYHNKTVQQTAELLGTDIKTERTKERASFLRTDLKVSLLKLTKK